MLAPLNRSLFLVALSTLALAPAQDAPVLLRWNLKVGEVLRYRMTVEQAMEMSVMPDAKMDQDMAMVLRQEVKQIGADGVATIDVSYEAVRMEVSGMASVSYDSTRTGEDTKKNDATLGEMFGPMLEVTLTMKLEPTGRISELKGVDAMLGKMLSSVGKQNPALEQMLKGGFGEEQLRKMFEANVFPEKPLAKGDSWTRDFVQEFPMLGTIKYVTENELAGVEERSGEPCARIAMEAKITLDPSGPSPEMPMKLSMDECKGTGTMYFAVRSGRLIENEFSATMDMDMSMPGAEEASGSPREMQMSLDLTQRMRLLGKDEPAFE